MSQPRTYPAGVPCWVDTEQPDPDAARRFYGELFGWTSRGEGGPGRGTGGGRHIGRGRCLEHPRLWSTTPMRSPGRSPAMWTREAAIRDPQGAELTLSQFTPPDDWG